VFSQPPLLGFTASTLTLLPAQLDAFSRSFDVAEAKQHARVTPAPGVNGDYDDAVAEIRAVMSEIDAYLASQKAALKCSALEYWGNAKDRFQIEVPENIASSVPSNYMLKSKRKGAGKKPGVWRCECRSETWCSRVCT
jgi:DNA mismatch repair protein MSH6